MLDATQLLATQIAAGVCLLIFVGLAYNLLRLRRRMEASKAWIKGEGDIIASEAKIPPSHRSDDAVIRYRYRVSDQIYESDCIKFGGQGPMSRAFADALVAKYPLGARVDVYFDPHMTRKTRCCSRASRTTSSLCWFSRPCSGSAPYFSSRR
jgi:hypothetical protein